MGKITMAIVLYAQKGEPLSPTELDLNFIDLDARIKVNANALANSFDGNYLNLTNKPTIPDLTGYYTSTEVDAKIAGLSIPTSTEIQNLVTSGINTYFVLNPLPEYATKSELFSGSYEDLTNKPTIPDLTGYATTSWVLSQLSNATVDLSDYYTRSEVDATISVAVTAALAGSTTDLTNYYTKTQVDSAFYNKTEVNDLIANASGGSTDLTNYYNKTEVNDLIASVTTTYNAQTSVSTNTTAATIIDSFAAADYISADYFVTTKSSAGVSALRFMVVHDGSNAMGSIYSLVGASPSSLEATMTGGNVVITFTPTVAVTDIHVIRTLTAYDGTTTVETINFPVDLLTETVDPIDLMEGSGVYDLQTGENTTSGGTVGTTNLFSNIATNGVDLNTATQSMDLNTASGSLDLETGISTLTA
jgi:hypothetical protein